MTDSSRSLVRVYLAISLDGFIAGPDDDLSWLEQAPSADALEPEPGGLSFESLMERTGALLMGRRTYDVILGFVESPAQWPYAQTPTLIATHRPLDTCVDTVRAVSGSIEDLIDLASEVADGKDIYIDGANLSRQALDAGLVDEVVLTVIPQLLTAGTRLFDGLTSPSSWRIVSHHAWVQGAVQLKLLPRHDTSPD